MYDQMTRDELIVQLQAADEEIIRLRDTNTRLATDYEDAKNNAEHWESMCLDLKNSATSEEQRQLRSERRRLAEWNDWARLVAA